MKAQLFFDLTRKTRDAQKLYFKTRLNGDLFAAKQLESQLDKALKEGLDVEPTADVMSEIEYQERMDFIENGDGDEQQNT